MLTALLLALQATGCDPVLVDSVGDRLLRLTDLDGEGSFSALHEVSELWRSASDTTPRAMELRVEGGATVAYWVESSQDRIHRGWDVNGNGSIEPFEEEVYRDSGGLDGASRPLALAATDDGALWWCSDAGLAGLFRCADGDGDGLAAAPGEMSVVAGGAGGTHVVETDAGPVAVDTGDLVSLATDGELVVAYAEGSDEALLAFRDADADGDADGPGESRLFLNATGARADLPLAADWASGSLRSLAVPPAATGGSPAFGRLSYVAAAREGGETAWYLACDSTAGTPYATNVAGQGLNGLVYRGVDRNGDGDLQDAGEVALYHDGSSLAASGGGFERIVGLDACGDAVHVAYLHGFSRRVARLRDGNGDGDASDAGELEWARFDSLSFGGPPQTDSLFVRGLAAAEPAAPGIPAFGTPNALFARSGAGCALPGAPAEPTLHGVGRARLGQSGFVCEVRGALPGTLALLFVGDDSESWYGLELPVDLALSGYPGCWQHVPFQAVVGVPTTAPPGGSPAGFSPGAGPASGYAAHAFPVPAEPSLVGRVFRFQWLVPDLGATPFPTLSATGRGEVEIEP